MKALFEGKKVLFTGRLDNFTREQAESLVTERGGEIVSRYLKTLNILVVGDKPGSKFNKVEQHNWKYGGKNDLSKFIKIMNETEFAAAILVSTPKFVPRKKMEGIEKSLTISKEKDTLVVKTKRVLDLED